jgi:hypothetical protein
MNYQIKIKWFGTEKIFDAVRNKNKFLYNDGLGLGVSEIELRNKNLLDYWSINKP